MGFRFRHFFPPIFLPARAVWPRRGSLSLARDLGQRNVGQGNARLSNSFAQHSSACRLATFTTGGLTPAVRRGWERGQTRPRGQKLRLLGRFISPGKLFSDVSAFDLLIWLKSRDRFYYLNIHLSAAICSLDRFLCVRASGQTLWRSRLRGRVVSLRRAHRESWRRGLTGSLKRICHQLRGVEHPRVSRWSQRRMIDLLGSAAVARCGTASVTQAGSNYARKSLRPVRALRRPRLCGAPPSPSLSSTRPRSSILETSKMSRTTLPSQTASGSQVTRKLGKPSAARRQQRQRKLLLEQLEDRRLLAGEILEFDGTPLDGYVALNPAWPVAEGESSRQVGLDVGEGEGDLEPIPQANPNADRSPFAAPQVQASMPATSERPLDGAPATYDLRNVGGTSYVTPVKNQGQCGSCWTFATMASLESSILMDGGASRDLSENNLKNYHGFDAGPCAGGNVWMSQAYFAAVRAR